MLPGGRSLGEGLGLQFIQITVYDARSSVFTPLSLTHHLDGFVTKLLLILEYFPLLAH